MVALHLRRDVVGIFDVEADADAGSEIGVAFNLALGSIAQFDGAFQAFLKLLFGIIRRLQAHRIATGYDRFFQVIHSYIADFHFDVWIL